MKWERGLKEIFSVLECSMWYELGMRFEESLECPRVGSEAVGCESWKMIEDDLFVFWLVGR